MADKLITDLQLRDNVTADVNFPVQDAIQSYRVTAAQVKSYVLAPGNVGTTELADEGVTLAKLAEALQSALVPAGSVMAYAGTSAPTGFLLCEGQAVSRTTYASLFAVLGVSHGQGDGTTTFNLPDYRGRFLRGIDGSASRDPDKASRTAMATGGNTGNNIGSVQADALQNITGTLQVYAYLTPTTGAFNRESQSGSSSNPTGTGRSSNVVSFDASRVARTSTETRPLNAYVNYIIKF